MTTRKDIVKIPQEIVQSETPSQKVHEDGPLVEVGQWYWAEDQHPSKKDFFGCVTHLGSNYVELHDPDDSTLRIHLNEFDKKVRREMDPEAVIRGRAEHFQGVVQAKLGHIKEITSRLGLDPRSTSKAPTSESRELSTFNAMPDLKKYKKELIQAKEKKLPELFKEVEEAHRELAKWMTARTIPMRAMTRGLEGCIARIEDRVFNVSLYAGLTEEIELIKDGEPATISEKLRLFQRMAFMDEECLVNYKHGGMEFRDIGEFDRWLTKPENLDRLLPNPRCMVAFRVRRETKERDWDGSMGGAFVMIRLEELDKLTFLYIRNGEKIYRLNCDLEFGEHIFPSRHQIDLSEPMMAKPDCSDFDDIITRRHWEQGMKEWEEGKRNYQKWEKENPEKNGNPYDKYSWSNRYEEYEPFDKTSVYYDDMEEEVQKRIKYYNRIALILQGLFDRSDILHPHPPAKLWMEGGMEALVELVYDGAGALHYGEPPDFEEYKRRCNATLAEGCFTIGQDDAWQRREAEREWSRRSWRSQSSRPTHVRPHGDPGPGFVAKIETWQPSKLTAVYRWTRTRRSYGSYWDYRDKDRPIPCQIAVSADKLFNVSAYKLGDFKQFYLDPRTRKNYLQWAELLLSAEEFHAGNLDEEGNLKKKKKPRKKK